MPKLDKETEKIYTEREQLKSMLESTGWAIAEKKLIKKVAELQNVMNITTPHKETVVSLIIGKQEASKILYDWLMELKGGVEQHKGNIGVYDEIHEQYILNIPAN